MADAPNVDACVQRYTDFRDLREEYLIDFHKRRLGRLAENVGDVDSVLDVGCNSGYLREYLPASVDYFGIDPSEVAVRAAQARGVRAAVGSAEDTGWTDNGVDVVVLGYILERVFDPEQVLREAIRVARWRVVGDTPHEDGPWGPSHLSHHPHDVRCFTEATLRALLEKFGTVQSITTITWGSGPVMYSFSLEVARG